jgi:hypothetical protein
VNHHIGSAESVHRLFEEPLHVCGDRHVRLHRDALAAGSLDICDYCLCWGRFSRVVHDHRKSISCQSLCDRASDSTRGAGDNRNLFHNVPPFIPPAFSRQTAPTENNIVLAKE